MANKPKNDVDYFPHEVNHGKKMHFIERKYKNDGYAVWHKLLEELGKAEYHYLNISEEVTIMFLSSSFNVTEIVLREIIKDLVKLEVFDKELYNHGILFNQKFIDSIEDAYKKRLNKIITKKDLCILLTSKGILKSNKSRNQSQKSMNDGYGNTQIKVEENKEDEIRPEETKGDEIFDGVIWPSFEDFWKAYDNSHNKKKCSDLWEKVSQPDREKIMGHVPEYVKSTPEKKFRKHPETYLRNQSWNDEIIQSNGTGNSKASTGRGGQATDQELVAAVMARRTSSTGSQ